MFKSGKAKVQADSLKTLSLRQPFTETGIAMVIHGESLYSNVEGRGSTEQLYLRSLYVVILSN